MNMRTYPLLCFLMLGFGCIPASGYAQFWQDIPIQDIPIRPLSGKRIIQPAAARGLSLDLAQIAQRCASAPLERTWAASNTQTLLPLPMPDGSQRVFRILESPIMESELAAQFPEIETFSGTDINDPSTTVRFDLTPQGFHAMILSPHFSTVFIDPYFFGGNDQTHYLSYHRADYRSLIPKTFECLTPANPTHAAALAQPRFADCRLRTYRLALAATGEYTAFHGGTVALALAAQVTTMNRVNGIFEREIAVRMNIINNNNLLIYTNAGTDPYTNGTPSTMINENQTNVNTVIGTANYDIGHVFGTNSGGLAAGGSVCRTSKARGVTGSSAPIGDPFDVDYVAHEVGHQFGANHSFNNSCGGNVNAATAMETGSGSTIMSYAGICAPDVQNQVNDYFHSVSLQEMGAYITGATHTCPVNTALANSSPVISSPSGTQQFNIPISTPFALTAAASDPNAGDVLTYCWEQYDNQISTQPPVASAPDGPNFRSFSPSTSPTRYFPNLNALRLGSTTTWEVLPSVSRSMRFRVTVRDNASGGGCTADAFMSVSTVSTAGPFVVTAPNVSSITWTGNTSQTVSWNVAGTNLAPISCANVDIRLSTDGGLTYPTVLASNVPNTGSATITAPNINTSTARVQVFCSNNIFFDISNQNFSIVVGTCALSVALSSTSVACNSVCSGNIISTVSNGVAPYVYAWSNASTTPNITGLCSGIYRVTVTDANACQTIAQASISQPAALSATTATTNASCVGNDGTASATVSGGTAPYAYLWSNGRSTANITGLSPNTYSLTITDANTCQLVRTATVGNGCAACAVSLSLSAANISCNGGANGTIASNITGANGAISYLWSNNSTTANLSGLAANTYSLTITDANSCTATAQSTLSQPAALSASTATTNASCVGNDGAASATVSGGTAPYAYLWSNGRTTANMTGLSPNNYNLTITDANACQLVRTATVGNGCIPCAVSLSLNSSNLSCNGVCNGAISANISGATAPIAYLWSNNSTTANISGLCAGTYSLTVTDANACTATAQNTLSQPTALSASTATTNVSCLGNDGTATATVSGGTAPYAYLWSNGRTTANMTGLTANTYSLTITDANACRLVQTATVGVTCIPCTVSLSLSATNLTCNGGASGSIASNVTGANGAVVYLWSNGRTTANLSNLNASTYSLTITDSNNCTATAQSTLSQPTALSLVTSSSPTACNMGGTASVTVSGGVAPYAYAWSNGATISNLTGLSIGNYPIVVRDANNCSITSTVSVVNGCFCSLTINPSISQPACNNSCNGQIALSLSGAAGAVSIIWTGGQTAQTLSGLCAGTYRVTVTDANNCSAIGSNLVLNNPSVLSASTSISNASCNGADGRAGIQVTGGTGAYTYAWSSGQNSQTATGLNVGSYTVSVTDANNCVLTSTANVGLTNTLAVTNPIINQNPNCFGANNGSAFVSAAGANNIRFLWTSGETNSTATALNAGINQVTVSAAGGCVVIRSVQLNSPTQIRTNISNTHTVCTPNSGILIANATNGGSGSGYQFVWSNGRSGSVQTGLSSGTYTLTITDGTGCSAISSTQISISTPPTLSATHTNPTCLAGGNINLSISPAANYTFLWSNGATTQNLSGIQGGIYTVEARNGTCVVSLRDTVPAVLPLVIGFSTTQPTSANSNDGSVSAAVSNGLAPFSYVWNNTSTSSVLLGIGAGNYQVTVTDANGCTATNSVNLSPLTNVSQTAQLLDEFSVYPNPSAGVFGVKIGFLETQNFELQVVDMLGQILFRQQYTSQQFQTQIDLSAYSTGIYLLRLQTDTIQKTIKIISKTN